MKALLRSGSEGAASDPPLPLKGVRVIDLTTSYAGPIATTYLGDLGADVVKVERPPGGDDARHWGPPFVNGESAWFLAANRNKRSIGLDVKQPTGQAALLRLLEEADVFVTSLNPATLERLGLAPSEVRERFPRLIFCALSGFGLTGPDRELAGYDLVAQARSGLMSVTGPPGGPPQRVSTALTDIVAGTIAAAAIGAALRGQLLYDRGELIDVALLEAGLSLMAPRVASYLAGEPEPRPSGASDSVVSIYQPFDTADMPIVVAIGNDAIWQRFCAALGLERLAGDSALATNAKRRSLRDEIVATIGSRLAQRSSAAWLELLAAARVPSAPIQFLSGVVQDPQLIARGAIIDVEHPTAGTVRVVGPPWRLGDRGAPLATAAPLLGADTEDVLREAGYDNAEIAELTEGGVAWMPQAPTA